MLPIQGAQVRSLVGELRSYIAQPKKKKMMSHGPAQGTHYKSLLNTLERGTLHISLDYWLQMTDTQPKWPSTERGSYWLVSLKSLDDVIRISLESQLCFPLCWLHS